MIKNFYPTEEQQRILINVLTAPTQYLAYAETRKGARAINASKVLMDLGLLYVIGQTAEVSDSGKQLMRDINLIDDSESLTDYGQSVADAASNAPTKSSQPNQQATEGYSLLRILNADS